MYTISLFLCYLVFHYKVMDSLKEEFPPMLPAGFHDITRDDMRDFFTNQFKNKDKRNFLIDKFFILLDLINDFKIQFEVWIDGSFTTLKEEPDDIDAAFFFNPNDVQNMSPDNYERLKKLFQSNPEIKARYCCDIYFGSDINDQFYWKGCFGFSRKNEPKGIVRIS